MVPPPSGVVTLINTGKPQNVPGVPPGAAAPGSGRRPRGCPARADTGPSGRSRQPFGSFLVVTLTCEGITGAAPEVVYGRDLVFPGDWNAHVAVYRYPFVTGARLRRVRCRIRPSRCHTVYNVPGSRGDPCGRSSAFPGTDVRRRDDAAARGIEE